MKTIIDKERWSEDVFVFLKYEGVLFSTHNAALDRIQSAVLEDEAALMRQVKLWSASCKEAEKRIAELEVELKKARGEA